MQSKAPLFSTSTCSKSGLTPHQHGNGPAAKNRHPSLQNRSQRAGVVAQRGVHAEVPDRLVDVGGGEDLHQRVLADEQRLVGVSFSQCLPGSTSTLAGITSSSLSDLAGRGSRGWRPRCARPCARLRARWRNPRTASARRACGWPPPSRRRVCTVSACEITFSASSRASSDRKIAGLFTCR